MYAVCRIKDKGGIAMKVYKPVAALIAAILLISGCNAANSVPEHTSESTETIEVLKDSAPEYITTTAYQLDEPIALDELEGSLLLEQTALSWAERKVGENYVGILFDKQNNANTYEVDILINGVWKSYDWRRINYLAGLESKTTYDLRVRSISGDFKSKYEYLTFTTL